MNHIIQKLLFCIFLRIHFLNRLLMACYCLVTKSCQTLQWPHGLQPTGLLCSGDFPGKNIGVGCHFLLQGRVLVFTKLKESYRTCSNGLFQSTANNAPSISLSPKEITFTNFSWLFWPVFLFHQAISLYRFFSTFYFAALSTHFPL